MTTTPPDHEGGGIDPNVALLFGILAYALVNMASILLLVSHHMHDPFPILEFFAFVAPVSATGIILLIHFSSKKGFHPLALTGFILLMILAALVNSHFWFRASAAV
jgi:hypothetical protein